MKKLDGFIFALGGIFSFILRYFLPKFWHGYDVGVFVQWAKVSENFKDLYNSDCYCNYPVLGLLSSAGLLQLLNYKILSFLYVLSFIDLINVVLVYFILRKLEVKRSMFWAGVIGLLPSTWAGGALWGQIDNIGQLILFCIIIVALRFSTASHLGNKSLFLFSAIVGVLFAFAFLTKQLLLFSLMPLSFMVLILILFYTNFKFIDIIKHILICTFFTLIPIALFDLWLTIPNEYYFSHLERVFGTGSSHMDKISGNGFNIWRLLGRDMWSSSEIPFYKNFTPKGTGLFLFFSSLATISYLLFMNLKKHWNVNQFTDKVIIFIFYLALVNISFNIFLTGTHERYLFHFYPFILIVMLFIRKYLSVFLCIVGAFIYGAFVLDILEIKGYDVNYKLILVYHTILYFYLLYAFKIYKGRPLQSVIE
ncbi:hypothetical protein P0082_07535 [Candidatus Haliotispira prima]|uniref:Glycosyltransferase RgtA/B/C/D-like domain-containing protein n=1 Tax=Candidatus Haliotispira prima TaxID=3034016 RepID=A0ABY8MEE0_9SPIO|nr:hypothetical protein P0082_07535 [Candidatus Haliotispira prima]